MTTQLAEEGSLDADYAAGQGAGFDVTGTVRVWRNLALGVGASRVARTDEARVKGRIPHPIFFDRHRALDGVEPDLSRMETAVHIQATWLAHVADAMVVTVFGGPTLFSVEQELVTQALFADPFPFNTPTLTGVRTQQESETTIGFHVGADVAYYFSRAIGLGGTARFSRGSVDLRAADGHLVRFDVGGVFAGGGLRIRFQ